MRRLGHDVLVTDLPSLEAVRADRSASFAFHSMAGAEDRSTVGSKLVHIRKRDKAACGHSGKALDQIAWSAALIFDSSHYARSEGQGLRS